MPRRSRILIELSEEDRKELDETLERNNFTKYRETADWLQKKGYDIGKSVVHTYGKCLEKEIAESKERLRFARILNEQCGDATNEVGEALTRIVQNKLFDAAQNGDFNNEDMSLASLATATSKLNYSSLAVKKFVVEMRKKLEEVAEEVTEEIKQTGLTDERADEIRRKILGVMKKA